MVRNVFVVDDGGAPLYTDHPEGQMITPMICTLQGVVEEQTHQYTRVIRAGRTVFVLQVHGPIHFLAVSDQGEPATELDADLYLVRDLMAMVHGPGLLMGERQKRSNVGQSKRSQAGLMRLIDTALALCAEHQSALVRSLEQLDVNDDIRTICATKLRDVLGDMPDLRCAALFVGTRVLAQHHAPGPQIQPHELMLLMMHVQALFRPASKRNFDHMTHRDAAATAADAERAATESAAAMPSPSPAPPTDHDHDRSEGASEATWQEGEEEEGESLAPVDSEASQSPSMASDVPPAASPVSEPIPTSTGSDGPVAASAARRMIVDEDFEQGFEAIDARRRGGTVSASYTSTPTRRGAREHTPQSPVAGAPQGTAQQGGTAAPGGWLPPDVEAEGRFDMSTLHLGGSQAEKASQHLVYSAELLPRIYLVIVARQQSKKLPTQRRVIASAHVALRDWLAQDYAPFLFTKERAHMPMLSYVAHVPGIVHFIFVDRSRHVTVAPTIAPLYGQELAAPPTHSVPWLQALVWRLVQVARSHLARGCTSVIVRSRGFQLSYRLWLEGEVDEVPAVERVLGGRPQPWVVTPQFYAELVQHYRTSRLCELFSVYVGAIPATAVARKDRQLLQVIASIHSSVAGF